jgi:hypothetical protein
MEISFRSRIAISGVFLIGIWIGLPNAVLAQVAMPSADNLEAQTPESQITDEPKSVASLFANSDPRGFVSDPSWKETSLLSGPSSIPAAPLPTQVGEPASDSNGWAFQLTPYLWMTGFNGILKIRNQTVPVSASFSDIFERLNFGFMGVFDTRKGRFGLLLDTLYTNLSAKNTIGPTTIVARSDNKLFLSTRKPTFGSSGIREVPSMHSPDFDTGIPETP